MEDTWVIIFMLSVIITQLINIIFFLRRIESKIDNKHRMTTERIYELSKIIKEHGFLLGSDMSISGHQPWSIDEFKVKEDDKE